jgi:hypothetical protein
MAARRGWRPIVLSSVLVIAAIATTVLALASTTDHANETPFAEYLPWRRSLTSEDFKRLEEVIQSRIASCMASVDLPYVELEYRRQYDPPPREWALEWGLASRPPLLSCLSRGKRFLTRI